MASTLDRPTRTALRLLALLTGLLIPMANPRVSAADHPSPPPARIPDIERWGVFEIALPGPSTGNPFIEVQWSVRFTQDRNQTPTTIDVPGFYDGNGVYRARFMPEQPGPWSYVTRGNVPELQGKRGRFTVSDPTPGNHGPVRVAHTFHFAYADGSPFRQIGTTCYAWTHQSEALQEQTLETLADAPFNKIRFCVFPKRYSWNTNEPSRYPFEGAPGRFDLTRFRPDFFQHFERRILDLQRLGIEADIILFHPYDRGAWGFDRMTADQDDRYLRYVIARLGAYRNVWWSLANEYDFIREKTEADWSRIGQTVASADPHHHLLGIHNGSLLFNHTLPWITHASIQNGSAVEDAGRAVLYRDVYRKPIVFDEVKYEGNVPRRWGNLDAQEMVHRFWQGTIAGTYVGHGETFLDPADILWWSKGGVLRGDSAPRLAFLRRVLESAPPEGIEPVDKWQHPEYGGRAPDYYLVYFGRNAPTSWAFRLPKPPEASGRPPAEGLRFRAEILDTWNMTVTPVPDTFTLAGLRDYFHPDREGRSIELPGRPYLALRILRLE